MMDNKIYFSLFVLSFFYTSSCPHKILAFFPISLRSHIVPFQEFLYELASRGHQVVEVSAFVPRRNHSNYHYHGIPPSNTAKFNPLAFRHTSGKSLVRLYSDFCLQRAEEALSIPQVQSFIENDKSTFDAIFVSATFCGECFVSLGHKYDAPIINFQPLGYRPSNAYILGGLLPPTTTPDFRQPHTSKMTLMQTLANVYMFFLDMYDMHFYYFPRVSALMERYLTYPGSDRRPDFVTLLRNISMTFIENDPIIGIPFPVPPNIQFTGGLHLKESETLPPNLNQFMNDAPHGVVYVSFGSLLQFSHLPKSTTDAFVDAFQRLKYRIIWKADIKIETSANILIDKWFPQTDILGHPNCKAFITHGGIHSAMEAGFQGIPLVMMPGFADQFQNVKVMEELGMGVIANFETVTSDVIFNVVEEVITNPKYKETLLKISHAIKTAPMSSLEKAVRWTEFVAENQGAPNLRSESRNLSPVRAMGLDILLLVVLALFLGAIVTFVTLKKCFNLLKLMKGGKEKKV